MYLKIIRSMRRMRSPRLMGLSMALIAGSKSVHAQTWSTGNGNFYPSTTSAKLGLNLPSTTANMQRLSIGVANNGMEYVLGSYLQTGASTSLGKFRLGAGYPNGVSTLSYWGGTEVRQAWSGSATNTELGFFTSSGSTSSEKMTILSNGWVGIGRVPRTALEVEANGAVDGGLRVSRGFLEVDGVNANAGASGGTSNLRIGYVAADRVGFNLQGLEALSLTTAGILKLSTAGRNGWIMMHGDSEGAKFIVSKGQGGNRVLRFVNRDSVANTEVENARFNPAGDVVFPNRATVEGRTDNQEAFIVDQKAATGSVVAQFRRNGVAKVTIKDNGDILSAGGVISVAAVKTSQWSVEPPDYVFEDDYRLSSLDHVEGFIKKNKHLPEVPSAKEIKRDGLDLAEMNLRLLKKVEELTLYAIQQEKRGRKHEEEIRELKKALAGAAKAR